jgi:8-oxo-dGTP pyrophosphatase MutT (NUDIX family)
MSDVVELVRGRLREMQPKQGPTSLRHAAVLIPVVVQSRSCELLLTRRSSRLRRQPGDIAFPGGTVESSDASPLDAALRESEEEVGLAPDDVEILGQLDERGTVTGFRITPFVGVVEGPYPFRANHEVAEVLAVPLDELQKPDALRVEKRRLGDGTLRDVYHYQFREHDIWGITGRLVRDFLALVC